MEVRHCYRQAGGAWDGHALLAFPSAHLAAAPGQRGARDASAATSRAVERARGSQPAGASSGPAPPSPS